MRQPLEQSCDWLNCTVPAFFGEECSWAGFIAHGEDRD